MSLNSLVMLLVIRNNNNYDVNNCIVDHVDHVQCYMYIQYIGHVLGTY